jgi:hypothetical protein
VSVSHLAPATDETDRGWFGTSEMAQRAGAFDWSTTPLGSLSTWSPSLKAAVAICLHSPFPMAIYWGPELNCIYNDAQRDVLGQLHPHALGQLARELLGIRGMPSVPRSRRWSNVESRPGRRTSR